MSSNTIFSAIGFPHTTELFLRLFEKAVFEVLLYRGPAQDGQQFADISRGLSQNLGIGKKFIAVYESGGPVQFVQQFQGMGDMRLRLALEKTLVAPWPRLVAVSTTNLA